MMTRRPFVGAIRFKLTAWYAVGLALILMGIGLLLSSLVERDLRREVDDRLWSSGQAVLRSIGIDNSAFFGPSPFVPFDPIAQSDIFLQVFDQQGMITFQSASLRDYSLPLGDVSVQRDAPAYETRTIDDVPLRLLYVPVIGARDDTYYGSFIVATPTYGLVRTLDIVSRLLIWVGGVGVVVAAIGGWLLAGRTLRPVGAITATAARIAGSADSSASLSTRLAVPDSGDELAQLAATFNRMLDRIEQTFAAHQRFVADASHELRTPLTAIRGNIDVMLRQAELQGGANGEFVEALEDVRRESVRMSRLIEDLLTLARSEASPEEGRRRRPVRLDLVVHDAARTAGGLTTGQEIDVQALAAVTVLADRDRLTQLLLILLDNAVRHTPATGRIGVALSTAGRTARLAVSDSGAGIASDHLPHIFDRFYRAEPARDRATGGTGLGLAIARAIARAYDGDLVVESVVGRGSTFTVSLPLAPTQLLVQNSPAASA